MLSYVACAIMAQERPEWDSYLDEVMTTDEAETTVWDDTREQLEEMAQHPIDLNLATREELEQLPFLTARQIEGLLAYRDRYGPLVTLGELRMITEMDDRSYRLLACLCRVGEQPAETLPSLARMLSRGKHELTATARIPLYELAGESGFLGYPYRHWFRYQISYGDWMKAGLVGAQDAGEPFGAKGNTLGYDYYSAYLQLRRRGWLDQLTVGQYRVSMGMGLVVNNGAGQSRLTLLQTLGRNTTAIRPHSGRSEDYLNGVAATVAIQRQLLLTAFVSYRPTDATLNGDSTVATLLTTGYHRTPSEMAKKHNTHQTVAGGSLRFDGNGLHAGLNLVYDHLDRCLQPNTAVLYRRYYPQGRDFLNGSIDYGYAGSRFSLSGETALDREGHLATLNSMGLRIGDRWNGMILQRFYSYRYAALHAKGYGASGRIQNESGLYLGATCQVSPQLSLMAYLDAAYFPWARYRTSQSSESIDMLAQATWKRDSWQFAGRYRHRRKESDNAEGAGLKSEPEHHLRLTASRTATPGWRFQSQVEACCVLSAEREWGWLLSQNVGYSAKRWLLTGGLTCFHTDSYASRLYQYEQTLLYTSGLVQCYGKGLRCWLLARLQMVRNLTLTLKVGTTQKKDVSHTDVDVQARWKF